MTNAQLGFIRGLGYAVLAAVCAYVVSNLGASGILPSAVSALFVAIAAAVEHKITG
jgi:hypothetical protein